MIFRIAEPVKQFLQGLSPKGMLSAGAMLDSKPGGRTGVRDKAQRRAWLAQVRQVRGLMVRAQIVARLCRTHAAQIVGASRGFGLSASRSVTRFGAHFMDGDVRGMLPC
jgi:hypothetical protein